MDIKTASIQELYSDMSEKWEILSELFSKKDERGKPRLAVFNINYEGKKRGLAAILKKARFFAGFECLPRGMPFKDKKELFKDFMENDFIGAYSPYYHLIGLNRQALPNWWYPFAMPEEVTHSIVQIKDDIISVDAIATAAFNGYSSYFGHRIYSALKLLGIDKFNVHIDEFFPPLGQSHILGAGMDRYKSSMEERIHSKTFFQPEKTKDERASEVKKCMQYLSSLAGFMLARQYKHDIKALLREHHSLSSLDGKRVWESYCKPLLMRGKL